MEDSKYTSQNHRRIVSHVWVRETNPSDFFHPSETALEFGCSPPHFVDRKVWTVGVTLKIGLDREHSIFTYFDNSADAEAFIEDHAVGTELDGGNLLIPIEFRETFKDGRGLRDRFFFAAGGDPDMFKIYECLIEAGVYGGDDYLLSKKVIEWAGEERIAWAKEQSLENWSSIIEMEYCTYHFPRTSLAFMAAQFHFNYYIVQDDYSAGYLMRGIELLLGGAEQIAAKALGAQKNAGAAGRKASQSSKAKRLDMFLSELEGLSDLVHRMSEQVILDQAFQNAIAKKPDLWRQGKGQQSEYETVLRSDEIYRARYHAVFPQTA